MARANRGTEAVGLLALVGALWYALHPSAYVPFILCNVVFAGAMAYSTFRATPEERKQGRREAWLIPVATGAVGALWVWFAAPEERVRAMWIAVSLVVIGTAIAWARRRAT